MKWQNVQSCCPCNLAVAGKRGRKTSRAFLANQEALLVAPGVVLMHFCA